MNARILVIEDNPANLELMRYLLEAFKYEVLTAEDGIQGVARAADRQPALVLCDIQLPDMDGYEVLKRIRQLPQLAATPVVAVTALAMVGDRDRILASGFDGYISKPIEPMNFVRQMEVFLSSAAAAGPQPAADGRAGTATVQPKARRTILAIDNLQANLDLVTGIFENFGYRVITALDAVEVPALAREIQPALILSDVCMPVDSGFDLIKRIKADPELADIPFVFITSTMANEYARRTGLALGAAKFLFRPIEPEMLLAEIEDCLKTADG